MGINMVFCCLVLLCVAVIQDKVSNHFQVIIKKGHASRESFDRCLSFAAPVDFVRNNHSLPLKAPESLDSPGRARMLDCCHNLIMSQRLFGFKKGPVHFFMQDWVFIVCKVWTGFPPIRSKRKPDFPILFNTISSVCSGAIFN